MKRTLSLTSVATLSLIVTGITLTVCAPSSAYGTSRPNAAKPADSTAAPSYGAGLNFFSAPYDYPGIALDGLFGYIGVNLATWNATGYAWETTALNGTPSAVRIGQGYWGRFPTAVTLSNVGTPASNTQPFVIPLTAGWNMVGNPFTEPILLSSLTFGTNNVTYAQASDGATPLIMPAFYSYATIANGGTGKYDVSSTLQPLMGYWVYALSNTTMNVSWPTVTVTGTLIDQISQQPLVGRTVTVSGTALSAITDTNGSFSIASVPVGPQSLVVTDSLGDTDGTFSENITNASGNTDALGTIQINTSGAPPPLPPLVRRK